MTKEELKPGQSLLTRVRWINKVKGNPDAGRDIQIELAEVMSEKSLQATFKPNDDRIIKPKPQLAWAGVERERFQELFNIDQETMARIDALPVSTGVKQLVEGQHYITLNIENPEVLGGQLRVQIVESTVQPNAQSQPKINPKTKDFVTHGGKLIYRIPSIVNTKPQNVFLSSDVVQKELPAAFMAPNANVNAAMG